MPNGFARTSWRISIFTAAWIAAFPAAGSAQSILRSHLYVSGLEAPLGFEQDPADPRVQFVVQQNGIIWAIVDGELQTTPFLDLRATVIASGESGLLGLAFPPDTATSRRFYVHFNTLPPPNTMPPPPVGEVWSHVARFKRSATNPLVADPTTRKDMVWSTGEPYIRHPFGNHKGGQIAFGPDGYLYIAMGDGGSGNDPGHFAQNPFRLLGKMFRLDVNVSDADPEGFNIPPDNPFVDSVPIAAYHEIWDIGLRNPWRFSFDAPALGGTGALIIGDVGQNLREEIDYEPPNRGGRNYGWRNWEGTRANIALPPLAYTPRTDPIFEYLHPEGFSITGGFVYRGSALGAAYRGRYFFGDFYGRVWSLFLTLNGSGEATASDLQEHTAAISGGADFGGISSFGQDAAGELYIVSYFGGTVSRIGPPLLTRPVLTSPISGTVGMSPTYRWRPVEGASAYELWVNDSSGNVIDTWYNAAALACGTECAVTPSATLQEGGITWWVRTWNADQGNGPWSPGAMVMRVPLARPTLISPSGLVSSSPVFEWTAVTDATHYYLWINDGSGHRLDRWYSAAAARCMGSTRCSVSPGVPVSGQGLWWVQAWSASHGYSPWSAGISITRAPLAAPTLVAPINTMVGGTAAFRWTVVEGATHYYLWVNDGIGPKITTWYMSGIAACGAAGTTTCSATASTAALGAGTGTWWVQAWSADAGYSPWSVSAMFVK